MGGVLLRGSAGFAAAEFRTRRLTVLLVCLLYIEKPSPIRDGTKTDFCASKPCDRESPRRRTGRTELLLARRAHSPAACAAARPARMVAGRFGRADRNQSRQLVATGTWGTELYRLDAGRAMHPVWMDTLAIDGRSGERSTVRGPGARTGHLEGPCKWLSAPHHLAASPKSQGRAGGSIAAGRSVGLLRCFTGARPGASPLDARGECRCRNRGNLLSGRERRLRTLRALRLFPLRMPEQAVGPVPGSPGAPLTATR
jgi:hypothetical protein